MTCDGVRGELSSLLDAELTEQEAGAIQAHLDGCPECRAELQSLRAVSAALAARLEPDPGFIVRFRERRDRAAVDIVEWRLWRRLALRLAPLAAAAVFGAVAGLWISAPSQPMARQATVIGIEELEQQEWGSAQAFATEDVMARPVLYIAMEPFPGGEP